MMRALRTFAAVAAFTATSVTASATPSFPAVLEDELKLTSTPACTACHVGATSRGTVTTTLGVALMSRGMVAYDEAALRTAIQALVAEKNPAITALVGGAVTGPEYGCTFSKRGSTGDASLVAFAAVLGLVLARRRR